MYEHIFLLPFLGIQNFSKTISRVYHKVKYRFSPVSRFYTAQLTESQSILAKVLYASLGSGGRLPGFASQLCQLLAVNLSK